MSRFLTPLFAPGFFTSGPVHSALAVGTAVAVVCGIVGVFAVIRGQSFAGHALSDLGATGGAAAFLIGVGPLWGFLTATLTAAGAMEIVGVQRVRDRDLAAGIVFGVGLGVAALFLFLDATYTTTTGATVTVLFGSLFTIAGSSVPAVVALGIVVIAIVLSLQRPLLLSSLSPELASSRGIPVQLVGAAYLLAVAVAAALSALTIGAILGTALLIGPAAGALRITSRPVSAMVASAVIGTLCTWVGIVLAYDSYLWPPRGRGWPVSFFVVAAVLFTYLGLRLLGPARRGRFARPQRLSAGGS
ncbi:MAG TPA: metal ABC transporter permease [Solirubrobacteraceae bacterium]|nr:metal ABC transporter permease [Solirubrobacteraceae bacterium]